MPKPRPANPSPSLCFFLMTTSSASFSNIRLRSARHCATEDILAELMHRQSMLAACARGSFPASAGYGQCGISRTRLASCTQATVPESDWGSRAVHRRGHCSGADFLGPSFSQRLYVHVTLEKIDQVAFPILWMRKLSGMVRM